jgi:tetratricopeptide (TPR) repeat protein
MEEIEVARPPRTTAMPLPSRIARARAEGRTQQALELAHQLCKQAPSPEHQELLRQVVLERGTQLVAQGHTGDAAAVFANALTLGGTSEYRATVAERLADSGDPARALEILGHDADPRLRQRVLNHAADAALRRGPAGRNSLPPELHAGFNALLQAFAHSEAGRDEDARAALQTIGLNSPFLDWKLLVRGLLAYYARDDARALDNWQRLDPARIPARLAAPLRIGIDAAFRRAQSPAVQVSLGKHAARLAGAAGLASQLNSLRKALANARSLGQAFRQAEPIVTEMRRDRPQLVPRLAHCFFWAIVQHGQPEDLDRYHHLFGPALGSDAELARLEALSVEDRGMLSDTHKAWQTFLGAITRSKEWAGEVGQRAQALVWEHMAQNAAEQEREAGKEVPFMLRGFVEKPRPLKPDAVTCLEKSIALAPERLDAYIRLFNLHREAGRTDKARKVGDQLLQRFPDHADTSEALGDLALETQQAARARTYFEKALAANPLERRLRGKLALARQNLGLEFTLAGRFEAARAEYAAALAIQENSPTPVHCQWAVLEMKADQPELAADLVAKVEAIPGQRLAVRYALVSESVRARLSVADRKRIAADLTAALATSPTPQEVLGLLEAAAEQRRRGLDAFRGQKTHEKTFLRFLDQISAGQFSEAELLKLCSYLQVLEARRPWQRCLSIAQRRFPDNPLFAILQLDYYLSGREAENRPWVLNEELDRARELVQQAPREQQEQLLPILREHEQQIAAIRGAQMGPMDMIGGMFGPFGPDDFDDEDEDDWM